jgi:hypothetical protein
VNWDTWGGKSGLSSCVVALGDCRWQIIVKESHREKILKRTYS